MNSYKLHLSYSTNVFMPSTTWERLLVDVGDRGFNRLQGPEIPIVTSSFRARIEDDCSWTIKDNAAIALEQRTEFDDPLAEITG